MLRRVFISRKKFGLLNSKTRPSQDFFQLTHRELSVVSVVERPISQRRCKQLLKWEVGRASKQDWNQFVEPGCVWSCDQKPPGGVEDAAKFREIDLRVNHEMFHHFGEQHKIKRVFVKREAVFFDVEDDDIRRRDRFMHRCDTGDTKTKLFER